MNGHFVKNGTKKTLPAAAGRANEKSLDVILPTSLDTKYDVVKLDTNDIQATYPGYTITWVNNFKLNLKKNATAKSTKVDYEVQFDAPNVTNLHLFLYDGSSVVMIGSTDSYTSGGKVAIRLHEVDPAIGYGS
jgi:hypothetical protein